jgi:peroxiredoxin
MPKPPAQGAKAPPFSLPDDEGGTTSLKDFAGQTLVLYFYPKDDTSGCTKEAIEFSALAKEFRAAKAAVVGVSRDSPDRHAKFRDKHGLKVTLASDEDGKVLERYGVWVEKSLYGRNFMGIERSTFLIDGASVVRKVWRKVKVAGHAREVLEAARALKREGSA